MSESQWFINVNGQNVGPLAAEDIRARLKAGVISPATPVWREGLAGWMPVGNSELMAGMTLPLGVAPVVTQEFIAEKPPEFDKSLSPYPSVPLRVSAFMIDLVLLAVPNIFVNLALAALIGPALYDAVGASRGESALRIVSILSQVVLAGLYFGLWQAVGEGSLGKRFLGLRLVRADLRRMQTLCGIKRFLAHYTLLLLSCGLGFVRIAWNKQKRGWHDSVADTVVVRADYLAWERYRRSSDGTSGRGPVSGVAA